MALHLDSTGAKSFLERCGAPAINLPERGADEPLDLGDAGPRLKLDRRMTGQLAPVQTAAPGWTEYESRREASWQLDNHA